jgi:transposase
MIFGMARAGVISDEFWVMVEPVSPTYGGRRGRPWNDHRTVLEGICWRYRTGSPWRDLPEEFGSWRTVWARHFRWSTDGTYQRILAAAKTAGLVVDIQGEAVDQLLSVDSTVVRAHQHAAGARRADDLEVCSTTTGNTGGTIELQEFAGRTC